MKARERSARGRGRGVQGKVPDVPKLAELKVGDAAPPLVIENLTRRARKLGFQLVKNDLAAEGVS